MQSKLPAASEAETRTESLKSILERAEALAKEIEGMPDCPRKCKLKSSLSGIQAIGDQFRGEIRNGG